MVKFNKIFILFFIGFSNLLLASNTQIQKESGKEYRSAKEEELYENVKYPRELAGLIAEYSAMNEDEIRQYLASIRDNPEKFAEFLPKLQDAITGLNLIANNAIKTNDAKAAGELDILIANFRGVLTKLGQLSQKEEKIHQKLDDIVNKIRPLINQYELEKKRIMAAQMSQDVSFVILPTTLDLVTSEKAVNYVTGKENPSRDILKILGLNPVGHYSNDDIRRAYRKMALKWHPDKFRNENAERIIHYLHGAKDISEKYLLG